MSYCRWSSDNWKSDLYCYADVSGGYTTHVAARRHKGDIPLMPPFPQKGDETAMDAYMAAHQKQMEWLQNSEHEPINGPHDGESFNDATLEEFRERVVMLKAAGYHVPDYVLEEIDDEIKEEKEGAECSAPN